MEVLLIISKVCQPKIISARLSFSAEYFNVIFIKICIISTNWLKEKKLTENLKLFLLLQRYVVHLEACFLQVVFYRYVISVLLVCITCKLTLCCLYRAGLFIYLFIRNHWMYSTLHKICTNIWICWQDEKIFALPLKMYHVLIYSLVFLIITWFCKK